MTASRTAPADITAAAQASFENCPDPRLHELMRALEAASIVDCAEMAAAASLFRTESRWGLYHLRVDHPERDDAAWLCHTILRKVDGRPACEKRPVAPYLVPIGEDERDAYRRQRIRAHA